MNRLFWGLFFVLIDLKLTVGSAVFDLLPDFIGFYMVMKGMESLAEESGNFDRGRHLAFGMTILSAILFGWELMDPDVAGKLWLWGLGFVAQIAIILILHWAVRGLEDAGKMGSERLRPLLTVVAVLQIFNQLLGWVPVAGKICGVAALIGNVCFFAALYGSVKAYQGK